MITRILVALLMLSRQVDADVSETAIALRAGVVQIQARREGPEGWLLITSGAIIDSTGLIVTQSIEPPVEIEVLLPSGVTAPARLLATDEVFRIAYLRVDLPDPVPHLSVASETPGLGAPVIAAGFLEGHGQPGSGYFAVSSGIVSSDRAVLDSKTMPGYHLATDIHSTLRQNLLFNLDGHLLSVAGVVDSRRPARSTGTSYYPMAEIPTRIRTELRNGIAPEHGGSLGIRLSGPRKLTVERVFSEGLRAAGMVPGDEILQYESINLHGLPDLRRLVRGTEPNTTVTLTILRDDTHITILATVAPE